MAANRRSQQDRSAATRDSLIQVARDLFAQHGYAAVGTETIVRQAGVTRGALYHQFTDKADLFAAVVEAVEAEVTGRIGELVGASGESDPIAVMKVGADTWLDACADPEASQILLVDAPSVLGWERWREIGLRYGMGLVQALITHAIEVGRIPPQPVAPLAHVLIGALDEAALFVVRQSDQQAAREEVRAVLARMIDALAI
jgi:AcrR family transcriptional regulator